MSKFKYKTDRQLAKMNIDPYGVGTYTNRLLADKQVDALNEGYRYGVTKTLVNLGLSAAISGGIWYYLVKKGKKKSEAEVHDEDDDFLD